MEYLPIITFAIGTFLGLLHKGITITHKHEQPEQPKKQEYNESMSKHLPAEVQQYYNKTNGHNRF